MFYWCSNDFLMVSKRFSGGFLLVSSGFSSVHWSSCFIGAFFF